MDLSPPLNYVQIHISLAPLAEAELLRCQQSISVPVVQVECRPLAVKGLYMLALDLQLEGTRASAHWKVDRIAAEIWWALGRFTRLSILLQDMDTDEEPHWLILDEGYYRQTMQAFRFAHRSTTPPPEH